MGECGRDSAPLIVTLSGRGCGVGPWGMRCTFAVPVNMSRHSWQYAISCVCAGWHGQLLLWMLLVVLKGSQRMLAPEVSDALLFVLMP